jgi:site-specific DNA-cytosine methylase
MKVLSLFDWISCARIALERAWIKVDTYYASEIDKYAIQVSAKNYPDIIHIGNVKDVSISDDVDLLIWWSPCQDLSIAKKDRKGLDWERSWLFREYLRILREVKPKWFILENVASMSKEAKETISKELWVQPIMINASLVSAQNRKRLFWTNIPNVVLPEDKEIILKDILESNVDEKYNAKEGMKMGAGVYGNRGKIMDIDTQKTRTLMAWMGTGGGNVPYIMLNKIRKLTPIECERLQGVPDNYTSNVSNSQRYKTLWNAFNVDVVARILSFIPR